MATVVLRAIGLATARPALKPRVVMIVVDANFIVDGCRVRQWIICFLDICEKVHGSALQMCTIQM